METYKKKNREKEKILWEVHDTIITKNRELRKYDVLKFLFKDSRS